MQANLQNDRHVLTSTPRSFDVPLKEPKQVPSKITPSTAGASWPAVSGSIPFEIFRCSQRFAESMVLGWRGKRYACACHTRIVFAVSRFSPRHPMVPFFAFVGGVSPSNQLPRPGCSFFPVNQPQIGSLVFCHCHRASKQQYCLPYLEQTTTTVAVRSPFASPLDLPSAQEP